MAVVAARQDGECATERVYGRSLTNPDSDVLI